MRAQVLHLLAEQAPANFAMVMATGIVSLALHMLGQQEGAKILLWINIFLFVCLLIAYAARAWIYPVRFFRDAAHHARGPGYFTIVAGTCILGNQCSLIMGWQQAALALFWFGALLWVIVIWGIFLALFTTPYKAPLELGINGAWLVATVCTQAVVILGCTVLRYTAWNRDTACLVLVALYGVGYMLYIIIITMIFYRFCYKPLSAQQLSPTFWINAGAMAVTTLAGSELMLHAGVSPFIVSILPFLKGMTVMAWGFAGWWIGLLVLLGIWRHGIQRAPITYTPEYWGMVFPLGMYTACTFALADALGIPALRVVPGVFIFPALAAWALTFYGMCAFLWRSLRAKNTA